MLTDDAYSSVFSAIEDSCSIYAETNLLDPAVQLEIGECQSPLLAAAATVSDIPDEEIKAEYEAELLEIAASVTTDSSLVDVIYQALLALPFHCTANHRIFQYTRIQRISGPNALWATSPSF